MSYLDALIYGVRELVNSAGTAMNRRSRIKVTGATLTDDPTNDWTLMAVSGGAVSSGASGQVQTADGAGAFSAPSNVLAGASYVSIGATPATAGALRLPNATSIIARNAADTGNVPLAQLDASDYVTIGDPASACIQNLHGGNDTLINHASGTVLRIVSGVAGYTVPISIGVGAGPVASDGDIRFPSADNILMSCRNAANTGDVHVLQNVTDALFFGTYDYASSVSGSVVTIDSAANVDIQALAGTFAMNLTGDAIDISSPVVGDARANSPYSIHGEVTINMVDSNYSAINTEYKYTIITNGSAVPMTAPRTLTLPNATDAAAYSKFVRNANGGAQNLIVQDVAAGTTVTIADGFGAWVGVHAAGCFRMSADVAP